MRLGYEASTQMDNHYLFQAIPASSAVHGMAQKLH